MSDETFDPRAHVRELAAEFAEKGDAFGWFEALYNEAAGDHEHIPWGPTWSRTDFLPPGRKV